MVYYMVKYPRTQVKHDLRDRHAVLLETARDYTAKLGDTVVVNLKGYDRNHPSRKTGSGDGRVVSSSSGEDSADDDASRGVIAAAEKLQVTALC